MNLLKELFTNQCVLQSWVDGLRKQSLSLVENSRPVSEPASLVLDGEVAYQGQRTRNSKICILDGLSMDLRSLATFGKYV